MLVRYLTAVLVALHVANSLAADPTSEQAEPDLETAAKDFVQLLVDGEFTKATAGFDATMKKALSPFNLNLTWKSQTLLAGAFKEHSGTRSEKAGPYDVVFVTCKFHLKSLDVKVVYDKEQKIAGLFFLAAYTSPEYVDADTFSETEVAFGEDPWRLPGTLAMPKGDGPFPAVVLVHGSGPNDRDETIGPNKPFKDLAGGLATQGIAVLRYDKRTKVHGAKVAAMKTLTVKEETVDDALHAARLLASHPLIDHQQIFVVGHSLGGYVMPRIATADTEAVVAGFISLAGSTRPLEDLIWEQTSYIFMRDGKIDAKEQEHIDKLKPAIARVKSPDLGKSDSGPVLGADAAYWLDLRAYDPLKLVQGVKRPMLFLQGERDYQVTMVDFDNWKTALQGQDHATFKSYSALNHLFITGTGKSVPAEYQRLGHVAKEVVVDIVAWIRE